MSRAYSILLAAAILLQSMLGGFAAAGTICLGGGHVHPQVAASSSCEMDCSHALSSGLLPAAVADAHGNCGCVDIELSIDDFLSVLPRGGDTLTLALLPAQDDTFSVSDGDHATHRLIQPCPSWFDPANRQHVTRLSSTRLIV